MRNSVLLAFAYRSALRQEEARLSRSAVQLSPKSARLLRSAAAALGAATLLSSIPVSAQDDVAVTEDEPETSVSEGSDEAAETSAPPARRRERINLAITVPRDESDQLLEEDCEEENDAGRIANQIIICRRLGEATDGSWNREEWERDYAERTQGGRTPDTFGIGDNGAGIGFGGPPPPALIIDVEALPDAPAGTDADRIARGLPPLGRDAEPTAEEIAERRRALGLDAPQIPDAPE